MASGGSSRPALLQSTRQQEGVVYPCRRIYPRSIHWPTNGSHRVTVTRITVYVAPSRTPINWQVISSWRRTDKSSTSSRCCTRSWGGYASTTSLAHTSNRYTHHLRATTLNSLAFAADVCGRLSLRSHAATRSREGTTARPPLLVLAAARAVLRATLNRAASNEQEKVIESTHHVGDQPVALRAVKNFVMSG